MTTTTNQPKIKTEEEIIRENEAQERRRQQREIAQMRRQR